MTFEFATAGRIVFGAHTLATARDVARSFGDRGLIVSGRDPQRATPLLQFMAEAGVAVETYPVAHEPSIDDAQRGAAHACATACDFVIGFGGGSAIDTAKAIAALMTNTAPITEYLEVIGQSRPLTVAPAPLIAIPTTAGTGSEVTRNAVLASPSHRVKVSLRSPLMLPRLAIVDPVLTYSLSPSVTATTGLDALTQLLEPYVSARANPLTDGWCVDGLQRVARSLRRAVEHGSDVAAREDMALASLFGGLALANAGLGAVHGFAGPIGGAFPAPHGAVCAALLPYATEVNLRALRRRAPHDRALARFRDIARIVMGRPQAEAEDLAPWLTALVTDWAIPRLSTYGIAPSDVESLSLAALKASSMKGNPIQLTDDERREILQRAL